MGRPDAAPPVIALLTDFGLRDHYVAAMKGVILTICPSATLLDITHDIPAQDIVSGALELEAVVPYLPAGAVVVAVVDPGVGTARRGIVLEAGGLRLVGPDNGLLGRAAARLGHTRAFLLDNAGMARPTVSRTFEGRDRFAPAAAWLATGVELEQFGPRAYDLVPCPAPEPSLAGDGLDGLVLRVDHFGNLMTNIPGGAAPLTRGHPTVHIGGAVVVRLVATYADAQAGVVCALVGSSGYLEIAVNGGSAAALLRLGRGAVVQVRCHSGA